MSENAARAPVVAMVGAGQLARMTHQAAIALGVTLRVLAEHEDDPAVLAGAPHLIGSPGDLSALRALAEGADVVTFDHEGVPPEHLQALEADGIAVAPSAAAKLHAQDKLHARHELARLGYPVPPFTHARTRDDAEAFAARWGWPVIAKTPRGGYDGRGVFPLADGDEAERELAEHDGGLLLEPRLAIELELAVLIARSRTGQTVAYPVVESVQEDAMCREVVAPAPVTPAIAAEAEDLALRLAADIGATGIMAVELFLTADGLSVNELALRPHNSGHYTIEGCVTSQFEQHIRAVLGWPLGATELRDDAVVMVNVVGTEAGEPQARLAAALAVDGAHVHLYGKASRPGRKLGHVTATGGETDATRAAARAAVAQLEGRT